MRTRGWRVWIGAAAVAATSLAGPAEARSPRFTIETEHGTVSGEVRTLTDRLEVELSLDAERGLVTVGPERSDGGGTAAGIAIAGIGSMTYFVAEAGGMTLIASDVADCDALARNPLYLAALDAKRRWDEALEPDPDAVERLTARPDAPALAALRFLAVAPGLVRDCREALEPDYGVCVVHRSFADCMACCAADARFGRLAAGVCRQVLRRLFGDGGDLGCLVLFAVPDCSTGTCAGKPGDPHPIPCGAEGEGRCMAACSDPVHDHIGDPAGACGATLDCCLD